MLVDGTAPEVQCRPQPRSAQFLVNLNAIIEHRQDMMRNCFAPDPVGKIGVGPNDGRYNTASLTAFTGRALITFLAGFALNMVGSFVNGFMPLRSFVAGFLITTNFANPGTKKAPDLLSSL